MRTFSLPLAVFAMLPPPSFGTCVGPKTRTSPIDPPHTVVVDQSGAYPRSYKTVNEGVAKLNQVTPNLFIYPGKYEEQVVIPRGLTQVVVQGYTCDTTVSSQNTVTLTHSKAQRDVPANVIKRNFQTSTLGLQADQVKVYNLNVANTAGQVGVNGQAVAVITDGNDHGFYACSFTGYQNTVAANKGRVLIASSHISGAVDFICGRRAMLWVERCDIEVVGDGWITANGNVSPNPTSEFVFNRANVYGKGRTYLGRPWSDYSRCVWQNSHLGDVVNSTGWSTWTGKPTTNVYLKMFHNEGPGSKPDQRASFSGLLDKPVDIKKILGAYEGAFFYDKSYM